MTTESRLFAAKLAEAFYGTESRAWTVYHPGQMTISDYQRLDKVDPWSITGIAYVKTKIIHDALECLGLDDDGWLVRSVLTQTAWMYWPETSPGDGMLRREELRRLPILRLADAPPT